MHTRRIGVDDWEVLRALRLSALTDAPDAFGSTHEREAAFSDSDWMNRAGASTNATFIYEREQQPCGIVTVIQDALDSGAGWLVGMWVAPSARATGAADALVVAALQWSEGQQISAVRLHVVEGNDRAERLYLRHGFRRTGAQLVSSRGLVEIVMERDASRAISSGL